MLMRIAVAAGVVFGVTFVAGAVVLGIWDDPPIAFAWFYFFASGVSAWVLIIVGVIAGVRALVRFRRTRATRTDVRSAIAQYNERLSGEKEPGDR